MELRHLEYFLAVAEERSFTGAARRLHVVQSGVSAAVRALERELGSPLFDRTSRRIALTDAGTALLPAARRVLDAAQAARDVVGEVRGGLRGTVSVGTMTPMGVIDLPALFGEFHAAHPGVHLRLQAAPSGSAGLARRLLDGSLDVAFVSLPGPPPAGLRLRRLAVVPMAVVAPEGYRPSEPDAAGLPLSALAGMPFIDSPVGYGNRTMVDQALAAAGVVRQVVMEVADVSTAADYVRHGLGVAVVPVFAVPADARGLRVLPVAGAASQWDLSVATASARRPSAALRALLELIERYAHAAEEVATG